MNSPESEILRLAQVWDQNSLLGIHQVPIPENQKVKIFNCLNRPIGDRRSRNAQESIFCSDRKDFYHQLWASKSRMLSNTVGPSVDLSQLAHLSAYGVFMQQSSLKKHHRERHGDWQVRDGLLSSRIHEPPLLSVLSFKAITGEWNMPHQHTRRCCAWLSSSRPDWYQIVHCFSQHFAMTS